VLVAVLCGVVATTALAASPATFKKQANALCAADRRKAFAIPVPKNPTEAVSAAQRSVALVQSFIRDLRALGTPAADLATMKLAEEYLGREIAPYRDSESKAANPAAYNADAAKGHARDAKARALFGKLGLDVCVHWDV
jgi:hypothetical protein